MSSKFSSSNSSSVSLLRRPRPPVHPDPLPPLVSQRSLETNLSMHSRSYPAIRPMPSLASHQDGLQSPVPTMQSDYEPVFQLYRTKISKNRYSHHGSSDDTTTGDTRDGTLSKKGLVLPYKPRGPDPFPMREPKRPADVQRELVIPADFPKAVPEFTLEDFLLENKFSLPQRNKLKDAILSRANYKKLTMLLEKSLKPQASDSLARVDITEQANIVEQHRRVPRRQLLTEMKTIIQSRLREFALTSPGRFDGRDDDVGQILSEIQRIGDAEGIGRKSQLSLFGKVTANVFHGSKRSGSPFDDDNTDSIITPSELSILNCLIDGGYVLSLKAHFIPELPELSPLSSSLIYLNLSFNEFSNFPREVLYCRDLQVLKLRNNPLKDIPHDISRLHKLRTLILSFCCLTALPISLFSLTKLEFFDVSYNKLTFLPNEIRKLERLRFLNVEGNELPGLPCGLLKLNLFRIRVRNNFMSPLFWKENARNNPQRLTDICLLKINGAVIKPNTKLPAEIIRAVNNFRNCDCCHGPMFGPGLRIIRPCSEIWGIKKIPFIFQSCSPQCYSRFIHNTDPKITEMIYGTYDQERHIEADDNLGTPPSSRESAITV